MNKAITIFTPTYNRAHLLLRLYDSLCSQISKDFVWLIVDDGSTDNTNNIVKSWILDDIINIEYYYQENGGKMRAHNRAVELCKTDLFVCVDSDDYLASASVISDTLSFWHHNNCNMDPHICGIVSLKKLLGINDCVTFDNYDTITLSELNSFGFNGETSLVFKTSVIKNYPFPVEDGEKFVTEDIVYDLIDIDYKYLFFPFFSQICEYQSDGYTKNGMDIMFKNPKGYRRYYNQLTLIGKGNKRYNIQMFIALSILLKDYSMFSLANNKLLTFVYFPLGIFQYIKLKLGRW